MNSRREFREIVKMSREGSAQKSLLPKFFGALRLFILLFLFSNSAFAQNFQNQQYDINDPRNPNCPCHKLQQMADEEYNKILNNNYKQNNKVNEQNQLFASNNFNNINQIDNNDNQQIQQVLNINNFNPLDNNENDNSSNQVKRDFNFKSRELSITSGSSGSRTKKKSARPAGGKSGTAFHKKLNKAKLKHSRIKKVRPNYAVCYKW